MSQYRTPTAYVLGVLVLLAVIVLTTPNGGTHARWSATALAEVAAPLGRAETAIGYRRQDEVGTLFCVTVDVQSLEDRQVTVRDRDTMQQDRIPLERVEEYVRERLARA